jgi:hypothetical protein
MHIDMLRNTPLDPLGKGEDVAYENRLQLVDSLGIVQLLPQLIVALIEGQPVAQMVGHRTFQRLQPMFAHANIRHGYPSSIDGSEV